MSKATCIICNKDHKVKFIDEYKLEVEEDKFFFQDAKIYKCEECNFSYVSPMPDNSDLNNFYENIYRQINRPPFWITDNLADRKKNYLDDKILSYLLYISTLIDLKKIKQVYDFGSGDGDLGYAIKKKFSHIQLFCSENDKQCQKILKEREYTNFKDLDKIDKKFDLILTTHSLEHMTDLKIFSKFSEILNPGGSIFFEVPNCTSEYFNGRVFDSPHLLFFTEESLKKISMKYNFDILNISFSSYSFSKDHKYQKESHDLYNKLINSKISFQNIKNKIKNFLPHSLLQLRRDYLNIKKNKSDTKLDWFANNTGDNCYLRGIIRKK